MEMAKNCELRIGNNPTTAKRCPNVATRVRGEDSGIPVQVCASCDVRQREKWALAGEQLHKTLDEAEWGVFALAAISSPGIASLLATPGGWLNIGIQFGLTGLATFAPKGVRGGGKTRGKIKCGTT